MSTHRTPHGSAPRRSAGGTDRPASGASWPRGRASGPAPAHDRTGAQGAPRAGKGGAPGARATDAAVITGRDRHGPDQPRSGPDKKARARALAGLPDQSGRGNAHSDARGLGRSIAAAPTCRDGVAARGKPADTAPAGRMSPRGPGSGNSPIRGTGAHAARADEVRSGSDRRKDRLVHTARTAPASAGIARSAGPAPQRRDGGTDAAPRRDPASRPLDSRPSDPRPSDPRPSDPRPADSRPLDEPQSEEGRARASTAKGTWLYGSHAVAAALANPQRHLRRLLLTVEAETAMRGRMAGAWPLTPERIDRARLDQLLGRDTVHGGVALLADPLAPPSLAEALARPGPVLVLDQVSDPRNVGAILRSAASFGACAVVVQDRNAPDETGVIAKAASGALERVPLLRAVNLARTLGALKAAGLWVVGLDAAGERLSGPALAERRVALVLGAEGAGLRRLTRGTCDELAGLPMPGGMESLNVSAAAAVALYELTRTPAP